MTDDMDRAQAREQFDRDQALAAQQARIAESFKPRDPSVSSLCIDCDEPIETERMRVLRGSACRCLSCAEAYEQRMRWLR